jgi:hypothetical protein
MNRVTLIAFFFLFIFDKSLGQIRLNILTIGKHEVYELKGTDIMVLDTLILGDTATLILNNSKKENFIHAKKIVAGKGAAIIGHGASGIAGKTGIAGTTPSGPCRSGGPGSSGAPGTNGKDGVSLLLYFDRIQIEGALRIDLAGGDGAQGGKGGTGGDGNPGTRLCPGGNGGDGGDGQSGGDGGNAGNLTMTSGYGSDLRSWMGEKIVVRSYGGFAGFGGDGGQGGQRGLGPLKDGNQGRKGRTGEDGKQGKPGAVFFEQK